MPMIADDVVYGSASYRAEWWALQRAKKARKTREAWERMQRAFAEKRAPAP